MTTRARETIALTLFLLGACDRDDIEHDGDWPAEAEFPQRMAEAYCAALFACDPVANCVVPDPVYASEAECFDTERTLLEEAQAAARDAGLSYDAACVEATILGYAAKGCLSETQLELTDRSAFDVCPPYHGTIPDGEDPCFDIVGSGFSDCGKGLLCDGNGPSCSSGSSDVCKCEAGFSCQAGSADPVDPDACVPVIGAGSMCRDSQGELHGVCDPSTDCVYAWDDEGDLIGGTCVARLPLGSPCAYASECLSLSCAEVCIPASPYLCSGQTAPRYWR
jgi:hypothetical protein